MGYCKLLIMLGQTSYYSKALCGALVQKLYLGFYSYNSLIQYCIENYFGKLFTLVDLTPNSYQSGIEIIIKNKLLEEDYIVCN